MPLDLETFKMHLPKEQKQQLAEEQISQLKQDMEDLANLLFDMWLDGVDPF